MKDLRKRKRKGIEESTISETNTRLIGVDVVKNTLVSDLTF
jgi:hypothetical protein